MLSARQTSVFLHPSRGLSHPRTAPLCVLRPVTASLVLPLLERLGYQLKQPLTQIGIASAAVLSFIAVDCLQFHIICKIGQSPDPTDKNGNGGWGDNPNKGLNTSGDNTDGSTGKGAAPSGGANGGGGNGGGKNLTPPDCGGKYSNKKGDSPSSVKGKEYRNGERPNLRRELNGGYIFVITLAGEFILAPSTFQGAKNYHIDLANGADVAYAGEMYFTNNVLYRWNNNSGHYEPNSGSAEVSCIKDWLRNSADFRFNYEELDTFQASNP